MSNIFSHAAARLIFASIVAAAAFGVGGLQAAEEKPAAPAEHSPPSAQRIDKLIHQLGDKDYFARQQAQDELARMGFDAFEALNAATESPDLEIASRARYLLRLMRVEWTSSNDPPDVKECLKDYELQNSAMRMMRMGVLAGLPDGRGIPALCRLVRFEKSSPLSKSAAVAFLTHAKTAPPKPADVEAIRKSLNKCKRRRALAAGVDATGR